MTSRTLCHLVTVAYLSTEDLSDSDDEEPVKVKEIHVDHFQDMGPLLANRSN